MNPDQIEEIARCVAQAIKCASVWAAEPDGSNIRHLLAAQLEAATVRILTVLYGRPPTPDEVERFWSL